MKRVKTYKTLNGFFKAYGGGMWDNITAENFFSKGVYNGCAKDKNGKHIEVYLRPSDELRRKIATEFVSRHWSRNREIRIKALMSYRCDLSYLQSFLIENSQKGKHYYGVCCSGDSYEYCRRGFSRSCGKRQF